MKRSLIMMSLALLLATPTIAQPEGSCCACVSNFTAQTSAPAPPPDNAAFFCLLVDNQVTQDRFNAQCEARNGTGVCLVMGNSGAALDGINCAAELQGEAGITCPAPKGVPVASSWWLGSLALALLAIGAFLRPRFSAR